MKIRGFSRLFPALAIAALALPLSAATPELDPLAGEVAAYLAAGAQDPATSMKLALRVGWSEKVASFDSDPARKAELLGRLAAMRRELAAAGRRAAFKAGGSAIEANGAITGRVTHDGAPIADARIQILDQAGFFQGSAYTGADGRYAIDMPPGTYYAYAVPPWNSELAPQLFDGLSCVLSSTCEVTEGTPIVLTSGGHRTANFALADLGAISGEVRRRDNLEPVLTEVRVFDTNLSYIDDTYVQEDGSYRIAGLAPGEYLVVAIGEDDLASMIFDGVACNQQRFGFGLRCPSAQATVVTVGIDQEVAGIDFHLYRGAKLAGWIREARTGLPVDGSSGITVWDSSYQEVARSYSSNSSSGYLVEGLAGGSYYASVHIYGYTPQYYQLFDCIPGVHCLVGARPIQLALGEVRGGIDFALQQQGTVSGRVVDEVTGSGIQDVYLTLYERASGNVVATRHSDSAGFFSFSDMPAVAVVLEARHNKYRGELYDDVDARLGLAAAKTIEILPGEVIANLEIELEPRGNVTVQALASESGAPLSGFAGYLYAADGSEVASGHAWASDGKLLVEELPPGSYFLMATAYQRAPYLHGKGTCNLLPERPYCNFAEGIPVEVRSGQTTDLGQIYLDREASFTARGFFEGPPGVYPFARVRLYEADGDEVRTDQFTVFGTVASYFGLAPGAYRLVADGSPNWNSVAYPDAPCSRWYCDPSLAEPFVLEAGVPGPDRDFHFSPIPAYAGCTASDAALCLNQGRYRVTATWRDFAGATGAGVARGLTPDSGYFYFFSPNNIEVLVKTLNGCEQRLGHHFWFYGAGLTNVQVELRVVDTLTGAVETYSNALGQTFQPILDNRAFATCDAVLPPAPPPAPAEEKTAAAAAKMPLAERAATASLEICQDTGLNVCLAGRFEVTAKFRTLSGDIGHGVGDPLTADTGTFYFFDPYNVELVVKILDACSTAQPGYWVFASGLTDVEVELTVTDKATDRSKIYRNDFGPYSPVIDLGSFPCN